MTLSPLDQLSAADPEFLEKIRTQGDNDPALWPAAAQADLVEESLWALSQDQGLAYLFAVGLARLGPDLSADLPRHYRNCVHQAAQNGVTLAQIMAEHLLSVLLWGDRNLVEKFRQAVDTMLSKGTYTLKPPLEGLTRLLKNRQVQAADAYLDLLITTFSKQMTYNLSLKFSYLLPQSIHSFPFTKCHFQIAQLTRVAAVDFVLAERFLYGLQNGLESLYQPALELFVETGLKKYNENNVLGRKFLGLTSHMALEMLEELKVAVSLPRVRPFLERSLRLRLGFPVSVRALAEVEAWIDPSAPPRCSVCSDGRAIYLPGEISEFEQKEENEALYKLLAKLESAALEFGTFDFDIDRLAAVAGKSLNLQRATGLTDFEIFFSAFDLPDLAEDLFNIFEQGRLRHHLKQKYPGFANNAFAFLREQNCLNQPETAGHLLHPLYRTVALGEALNHVDLCSQSLAPIVQAADAALARDAAVERSALLTLHHYNRVAAWCAAEAEQTGYTVFRPRLGRRIQPALLHRDWAVHHRDACKIREILSAQGVDVYVADLRKELIRQNGVISTEDLTRIILTTKKSDDQTECLSHRIDLASLDLKRVLDKVAVTGGADDARGPVQRYKEWDLRVSDYINDHVRVVDHTISGADDLFYRQTLSGRAGLVGRMRKAFELLKPEGLLLLRQWIEGDDFDYRALIDFAIDRRAGIMPSDRLYIKRLKQNREVAVLLLVDVSRSTANCIAGTGTSVLSVQKEAIVLFCEALRVVGDDFAIAGFSGAGRLNVDYFRIKNFDEPMTAEIKARIGAIAPQRSTRMGAAIRHAAADLGRSAQKVRLLLILSDGFPNDVDYKGEYAVADTRTAILEARAKNIVVKAITVNMGSDARLNDLYGSAHHQVIEDVRDLPDQLLRMYGKLTRV